MKLETRSYTVKSYHSRWTSRDHSRPKRAETKTAESQFCSVLFGGITALRQFTRRARLMKLSKSFTSLIVRAHVWHSELRKRQLTFTILTEQRINCLFIIFSWDWFAVGYQTPHVFLFLLLPPSKLTDGPLTKLTNIGCCWSTIYETCMRWWWIHLWCRGLRLGNCVGIYKKYVSK